MTNATLGDSVLFIGDSAFRECTGLTSIVIPDSVTSIGLYAFRDCYQLASVTIGRGVDSISPGVFRSCIGLENVMIRHGVTSIGPTMFDECTSLISIAIPNSVTTIGAYAFDQCSGLSNIMIPDSVTSIGSSAFRSCSSLTAIILDANNPSYSSVDGVLFNKDQTELLQYPEGKAGSYTIPASVTAINSVAFRDCTGLTAIILDANNPSFSSVDGVLFNKVLTELLQCPAGKTGSYTVPASVTSIKAYAFSNCKNLNGVYFKGNAPNIVMNIFYSSDQITVYYLPGTTGLWGATFGYRPTVLWNPLIQMDDGNFGVQADEFGFNIAGHDSELVKVETCTNLTAGVWEPVLTTNLTAGTVYVNDPEWINHPTRYYRLSMP
jgi:hypothetical protein